MSAEVWRSVAGYAGAYSVSSLGRVRSNQRVVRHGGHSRRIAECILSPSVDRHGYQRVNLSGPMRRTWLVHQLVLYAFVGPRPAGFVGCHGDGNQRNCEAGNLRWDTQAANVRDAQRHGTVPRGEEGPGAKLSAADVNAIRASHSPQTAIAAAYGISASNVSRIKSRDTWSHI